MKFWESGYDPAMTKVVAKKETGIAIGLTIIGFFGLAGLQHFYLGKPVRGIVWVLTLGLFFIGTIVDVVTMGAQVKRVNGRS